MAAILVFGRDGQLGQALATLDWGGRAVRAYGRDEADLVSSAPAQLIARERPQVVINAAAYTNVEGAQRDRERAFAVNAAAPGQLAQACAQAGAWLIHFSTDYVFDGAKQDAAGRPVPYIETDTPAPLNVYGESKLAGERAVAATGTPHLILRTSWVYSRAGENFVNKILARARAGAPLRVVNDQFGAPTWADALARATRQAIDVLAQPQADAGALAGLYHLSAAGASSWFEVAREALRISVLDVPLAPVSAAEFAAAAPRPRNSLLDSGRFAAAFGHRIGDWRKDLRHCLGG
jgi:dTDP-4-dehydrorhamnose reductase